MFFLEFHLPRIAFASFTQLWQFMLAEGCSDAGSEAFPLPYCAVMNIEEEGITIVVPEELRQILSYASQLLEVAFAETIPYLIFIHFLYPPFLSLSTGLCRFDLRSKPPNDGTKYKMCLIMVAG